jgi:hypothetical protein
MAMKPKGTCGPYRDDARPAVMARTFQKFLYNLRDYSDRRFATTA